MDLILFSPVNHWNLRPYRIMLGRVQLCDTTCWGAYLSGEEKTGRLEARLEAAAEEKHDCTLLAGLAEKLCDSM
jgi:hypothetical protein